MRIFNKPQPIKDIKPLKHKTHWKLWLLYGIFMISLISMAGYGVKSFFDKYFLIFPVQHKIVSPEFKNIQPKKEAIRVVEPIKAYASETKHYEVSEIVDKIFTLESSRGRQDGCRNQGLYNGYGFRQNTFEHVCYGTQEEVVNLVTNWVTDKRDKGFSTAEIYCYYNLGIKENDCPYYRNAISL